MTTQTVPGFDGKLKTGLGETKIQSRIRNDNRAASIYSKRTVIDSHKADRALRAQIKEVWDD